MARIVNEGLSLERSFACFVDDEFAGICLNGFRVVNDEKIAWNGGMAVVPSMRGQGVAKAMMTRNFELYREAGINHCYLEVISRNQPAIRLYENFGYRIIDRLYILTCEQLHIGKFPASFPYRTVRGLAVDVVSLPFYDPGEVWQGEWQSLKNGECIIVWDDAKPVGFALFKRTFDSNGGLVGITLHRCEASPGREDAEMIVKAALRELLQPQQHCRRTAMNIRAEQTALIESLKQLNFSVAMEQELMVRKMT